MTTVIYFILAFIIGIIIGVFYFQLLWITVSNLPKSKRPYLLSLASLFVRLIVVFLAFFLIIKLGNWQHLIVCLVGFIGVRIFFIKKIKHNDTKEE
jgi:F1F0 ATPase subunit 2